MAGTTFKVDDQFVGKKPNVRAIYDRLLEVAKQLGPFEEEPKKTSIHLSNGRAFAGIHTRKDALLLTLVSDRPMSSPRIEKVEQASKSRYHLEVRLSQPEEVDSELVAWLQSSYALRS